MNETQTEELQLQKKPFDWQVCSTLKFHLRATIGRR